VPSHLPPRSRRPAWRTDAAGFAHDKSASHRQSAECASPPPPSVYPARADHRGCMWDPTTMNSVSREPQLPQRRFICTSGTSPRPATISAARSAFLRVAARLAPRMHAKAYTDIEQGVSVRSREPRGVYSNRRWLMSASHCSAMGDSVSNSGSNWCLWDRATSGWLWC
jgi:hypothetical protein